MSVAAVGKGKKADGYPGICRLQFGKHLGWRNPRCVGKKGRERFGRNHEWSNSKCTGC